MSDHASHASRIQPGEKFRVRVKRQGGPGDEPQWQEFELAYKPGMNVISCLMELQRRPLTASGGKTTPVAWDSMCLEEVCGACSMVINGGVRQACSALVHELEHPITLEPMTKFPLVRDLAVDRQVMFENLKRVKAWIPIDGTYDLGPGPRQAPSDQQTLYFLSTCMTCGCCLEACPQISVPPEGEGQARAVAGRFMGAAIVSQVRLFNGHPTGKMNAEERLRAVMGPGGIQDCGKAQNCAQVCPKQIPLTTSIAAVNRAVTLEAIKGFFLKGDGDERVAAGPA